MLFSWLRRRRRRRLLSRPFPPEWLPYLERLELYRTLAPQRQARLRDLARVFVDEKHFEGCAGLQVTDEMRVTVAAQACLLILELDHAFFRGVQTILIYPASYRHPRPASSAGGFVPEEPPGIEGEAWRGGPLILSWNSVLRGARHPEDGSNLVFHEFAHKLDQLDGFTDGLPPARGHKQHEAWQRIVKHEYDAHLRRVRAGDDTFLGAYAATNPAEFFAVASERFFEQPLELGRLHPDLYELLAAFYRQRPGHRTDAAP